MLKNPKMFLSKAFQKTVQAIRKNRLLFIVLFLSQAALFTVLAFIHLKYQLAIVENLRTVVTTLQTANYNETLIKTGTPFLENPQLVYQSYASIWLNLKYLLGFSFLAFLIFEGINWTISHCMLKKQNPIKTYIKFVITSLIYLAPSLLIVYLILKNSWETNVQAAVNVSIVILIIVFYFMLISFSLLNNKIKNIFKITFKTGLKKIDYLIFTLIVGFTILSFFSALMYTSTAWAFSLMIILIILFIIVLNIIRIFFISAIRELA